LSRDALDAARRALERDLAGVDRARELARDLLRRPRAVEPRDDLAIDGLDRQHRPDRRRERRAGARLVAREPARLGALARREAERGVLEAQLDLEVLPELEEPGAQARRLVRGWRDAERPEALARLRDERVERAAPRVDAREDQHRHLRERRR